MQSANNLILGTTNEDYHSNKTHLSSSALKTLLKDPQQFHREYILGIRDITEKIQFVEGTLTHALLLEPHKILTDYAVFPGLRKAGAKYEEFLELNPSKIIVSAGQMLRCEALFKAYKAMPVALALMDSTLPESNMVGNILDVPVKARADAISIERACIIDVKTTSMPSDAEFFKQTIVDYSYDLSAALYCEIARQSYRKLFDFYWLVLSKADNGCHIYKASTETLSRGTAKVTQALVLYKKCLVSGQWLANQPKDSYSNREYEIEEL